MKQEMARKALVCKLNEIYEEVNLMNENFKRTK